MAPSSKQSTPKAKEPPTKKANKTFNPSGRKNEDWDDYIGQLKLYKSLHGTANVPKRCKEFPALSRWVENLRRRKHLTQEQQTQLNDLGFTWKFVGVTRKKNNQWDTNFQLLKQYQELHGGDCCIPHGYTSASHPQFNKLPNWVKNQRADYHKGTLEKTRQTKLESIGFTWRIHSHARTKQPPNHALWMKRYRELIQFKEKEGHARVPLSFPENAALGDWVNNQRTLYATGLIRKDRQELLEEIGFEWSPSGRPSAMKKAKKANAAAESSESSSSLPRAMKRARTREATVPIHVQVEATSVEEV